MSLTINQRRSTMTILNYRTHPLRIYSCLKDRAIHGIWSLRSCRRFWDLFLSFSLSILDQEQIDYCVIVQSIMMRILFDEQGWNICVR